MPHAVHFSVRFVISSTYDIHSQGTKPVVQEKKNPEADTRLMIDPLQLAKQSRNNVPVPRLEARRSDQVLLYTIALQEQLHMQERGVIQHTSSTAKIEGIHEKQDKHDSKCIHFVVHRTHR